MTMLIIKSRAQCDYSKHLIKHSISILTSLQLRQTGRRVKALPWRVHETKKVQRADLGDDSAVRRSECSGPRAASRRHRR